MSEDGVQLRPGRRRYLAARTAAGFALLAVLWYFVGRGLAASFRRIDWQTLQIDWVCLAAALAVLLLARLTNALNCRQAMATLGHDISNRRAIPIIWFASLGRYIPGKFAAVAGALYLLNRAGLPLHVAAGGMFLSVAMMILTGLVASTPLLFMPQVRQSAPWAGAAAVAIGVAGAVCLHPLVFTRLLNVVLRILRRPLLPARLAAGPYVRVVGITLLRIVVLGAALWLAGRAVGPLGMRDFPMTLAAGGLASVAGFLAVFAPAGLGAHEGVYLLTMTPLLGPPAGLMVAIFRLLNVLSDVIAGAAGMALLRGAAAPDTVGAGACAGGAP